jgi:hypothetical protein
MRREPRYLYLTIILLAAIVCITSAPPVSLLSILGVFTSAVSLMVSAWILSARRRQLLLAVLLGALALLPLAAFSVHRRPLFPSLADRIYPVNLVVWLLFTLYVTLLIFRGIMTARRIRGNEIYGAIYVYLLIGVLFAQIYQLLLAFDPGALYFDPGRFPGPQLIGDTLRTRGAGDVLYYSFVTLGTVGYGDVTPGSPLARSLSLIEAVIGIMYVATMIARFVSIQIGVDAHQAPPARSPQADDLES